MISRTIASLGVTVMLFVVAVGGCEPQAIPTKVGYPLEVREKVIAKDPYLQAYLRVTEHQAQRINGDLLKIRIAFENIENDVWADIQVMFRDDTNFELEKTNWQPQFFPGKQVTYYETTSLSSKAADYTVILRQPRKLNER